MANGKPNALKAFLNVILTIKTTFSRRRLQSESSDGRQTIFANPQKTVADYDMIHRSERVAAIGVGFPYISQARSWETV